jgi:hypothetical protein
MRIQDFCAVILCFWVRVLVYFEGLHLFNLQCQAVLSCWSVSLSFFRLFSTLCPVAWCRIVVDLNFQSHFICNSWHDKKKMKYCHFINLHTMLSVALLLNSEPKCVWKPRHTVVSERHHREKGSVCYFLSADLLVKCINTIWFSFLLAGLQDCKVGSSKQRSDVSFQSDLLDSEDELLADVVCFAVPLNEIWWIICIKEIVSTFGEFWCIR